MMFAQALAACEYQIRYFSKVGVSASTAHKAKAAIRAYRILKECKRLREFLSSNEVSKETR